MPKLRMQRCAQCKKNRNLAKFYHSPKSRVCLPCQKKRAGDHSKNIRLQETYGITLDEWQDIVTIQGGCCAICQSRPISDTDHDHNVERRLKESSTQNATRLSVRGILCKTCNRRLLPASRDRADWCRRAADYLDNPPAKQILR